MHRWNISGLKRKYAWLFGETELVSETDSSAIFDQMVELAEAKLDEQREKYGEQMIRALEHKALIENVDMRWMDHIDAMEQLKRSVGLKAYGQRDPVLAFREESSDMFEEMITNIREGTVQFVLCAVLRSEEDVKREQKMKPTETSGGDGSEKNRPVKKGEKVGRNDPCPCGSGLKYKKCCGKDA